MSLVSATRLDAFADPSVGGDGCQRLGAFKYWGKQYGYAQEPKGDNANFGIRLHKFAEDYLEHGIKPDTLTTEGELFLEALQFLPDPGAGGVEGEKTLTVAGINYGLTIDLHSQLPRRPGIKYPDNHPRPGRAYVGDHKTSSNPKAYGLWQKYTTNKGEGYKERKGFLDDTQAILYASWDLITTGDAESDLMWLYYGFKQTKRKDPLTGEIVVYRGPPFHVKPSYITLGRNEVEEAFEKVVHPRAELVLRLESDRADPKSLDPNPGRCTKYNRDCFYTKVCGLSAGQRLTKIRPKKEKPMALSLKEQLEAKKAAARAAAEGAQAKDDKKPEPKPEPKAEKKDIINPPEASSAPAQAKPELKIVTTPSTSSSDTREVFAVFAQHLGAALTKIAEDLRRI